MTLAEESEMITDEAEQKEFERMYNTYNQLLYRVSWKILRDTFLAEDAVSTTFMRAAANFSKLNKAVSRQTKHFLIITCQRASLDIKRKCEREARKIERIENERLEESYTVTLKEEGTIGAAITEMPEIYQQILMLRFYNGYSTKEIAKMLSISEAKTAKCLTEAKRRMKEVAERKGYLRETD